jgi:hypothetical protein
MTRRGFFASLVAAVVAPVAAKSVEPELEIGFSSDGTLNFPRDSAISIYSDGKIGIGTTTQFGGVGEMGGSWRQVPGSDFQIEKR